jgi:hypothetical protein
MKDNRPDPLDEVPDTHYGNRRTLALALIAATCLTIAYFVMTSGHPFRAAVFVGAVLFIAYLLVAWADATVEQAVDRAQAIDMTPRAAAAIADLMSLDAELRGHKS